MKVLHVDTGSTWRGGQAQIHHLLKYFPDGELENHLLCPADSPLPERLEDDGVSISIHHHPLRGEWDLSAAWKVHSLQNEYDFDLIHCHSSRALGITWVASLIYGLPPFIETRRLETQVGGNFLSQMKYDATDHHIANSKTVKEGLIKSGIDEESISVIPSGIDMDKINTTEPNPSLLEELGLNADKPVIGNVGALCPQKNQKDFIDAANLVLEDHNNAQFVIAGEGELREDLERQIQELKISDNVKLAGFVDDIFGLMKTFDLFLFTSLYEGLCGTLLQIMACEVPLISSDIEGSKQILNHRENCIVVSEATPSEFATRVSDFLNGDMAYSGDMLNQGYKTAKKYNYKQLSQKTKDLYKNQLNDPSAN